MNLPAHRLHLPELDALRGLASVTVLIDHYSLIFRTSDGVFAPVGRWLMWAQTTPLYVLFAGHESVVLFFLLSGFVLSLPYLANQAAPDRAFLLRRVCRIYLPYLPALLFALVCARTVYRGPIHDLSPWFNKTWAHGIQGSLVLDHLTFLGSFNSSAFDPVLWSLVVELRVSLLFPWLARLWIRLGRRQNSSFVLAAMLIGQVASTAMTKFQIDFDYFLTITAIGVFLAGFLLAQNIRAIEGWYRSQSTTGRIGFACVGFLLYAYAKDLPGRWLYFEDIPIMLGASMMTITAICSRRTGSFLRHRVPQFFGRISYSLYLYHAIVLLAVFHTLYGTLPVVVLILLAMATTVLLSQISYTFVELPSISLGRRLSRAHQGGVLQQPQ